VDRSPRVRAEALVRATLSLGDAALRSSYVASVVRSSDARMLAPALDVVCERAEQAESGSREALVAIVDALNAEGMDELVQRLREEAIGASLLALERLIRNPPRAERERRSRPPVRQLSNDGRSRPLTLGERKSLARRPDRDTMQRLLSDPHPDVIRRCLRNPRMTEDDVVRLAAKRPGRGEVLAEIARSAWVHRPRIRVALVLNPASPLEIVARILGLLLRSELTMVARSPAAPPGVRALSLEHLGRRPPVSVGSQGSA
jgi:hypothetical protein